MKKLLFSAMALVLLVGSGCKKDKKDATCSLSDAAIVGNYKLTGVTSQTGNQPENDVFPILPVCIKDNVLSLNANHIYQYQDLGTVCADPGNDMGTWALSGNTITLISVGDTTAMSITTFSCGSFTTLQLEDEVKYRATYTRQ